MASFPADLLAPSCPPPTHWLQLDHSELHTLHSDHVPPLLNWLPTALRAEAWHSPELGIPHPAWAGSACLCGPLSPWPPLYAVFNHAALLQFYGHAILSHSRILVHTDPSA